jgi:hypothetical protein
VRIVSESDKLHQTREKWSTHLEVGGDGVGNDTGCALSDEMYECQIPAWTYGTLRNLSVNEQTEKI